MDKNMLCFSVVVLGNFIVTQQKYMLPYWKWARASLQQKDTGMISSSTLGVPVDMQPSVWGWVLSVLEEREVFELVIQQSKN